MSSTTSIEAFGLVAAVAKAIDEVEHEYDRDRRLSRFLEILHAAGYVIAPIPRPLHELFAEEEARIEAAGHEAA